MCDESKRSARQSVILMELYWGRDKDPRVPLGHASLRAALEAWCPEVEVVPVVEAVNRLSAEGAVAQLGHHIMQHVEAHPGAQLAIGAYVWAEHVVSPLLSWLRQAGFAGRIILGGPQISYQGAGLEALYPEADVFIRGYGERALCDVILATDEALADIEGVHVRGGSDANRQAKVAIEELPSPWLMGLIPLESQPFVRWETQRGCLYRCTFCQHQEAGRKLERRVFNGQRVRDEIALFCRHGVRSIAVLDPIFNIDDDHATGVLEAFVAQGYTGKLSLQCRAERITERFLDVAAALDVTLEFGLQTIHKEEGRAVKRGNAIEKVHRALEWVRERDIDHEVSLIFGLPTQTLESFMASVDWCLTRHVPRIKAFPLMLLRGTALEQQRAKWGLVERAGEMPIVVASSSFTPEQWGQMNAISQRLKETEGAHPGSIEGLVHALDPLELSGNELRWRPRAGVVSRGVIAG